MRKPFHKHLAHHVRNAHRRITKYLYERDTIFATAWVFIFILLVKVLPLPNMHFFDPIEIALEDFDFNDITYSKLKTTVGDTLDKRIVIINIGEFDREGLALLINKTSSMGAKVIGLDATMEEAKDPYKDSLMQDAIARNKNLVLASRFHPGEGKEESQFTPNYFSTPATHSGYVNFLSKEWATVRIWNPFIKDEEHSNTKIYQSFATTLIEQYDPVAFEKLKKRKHNTEIINYSRRTNQYLVIEGEDLLQGNVDSSVIKGRIALLGYINHNPENIEDKKYTPFNEEFAGKSIPDMNGIVIHANIISMALDGKYINKLPLWATILFAVLIGWLHMSFFIHYYLENHIWFHLVAKIAQLISAILFVYIGMELFSRYQIKLDMTLTLVVIVLAVDIIYFYEAFAVWIHKKFGYTTVFHQKHH
ncbi:MAG TPA: CHASE2 domain-containing protein [Chitinophagaceae bacterium]|jgi:CHASE2 domain-containing sensor protein|nr:CHASE2 domain-containing protein [Chitinophagaceae bacterium]